MSAITPPAPASVPAPTGAGAGTGTATATAPVASASDPRQKLQAATQGFEAIFLRQMLHSARDANFGGNGIFDSDEAKQIATMSDDAMADTLSKSGAFGLARTLENQLARQLPPGRPKG